MLTNKVGLHAIPRHPNPELGFSQKNFKYHVQFKGKKVIPVMIERDEAEDTIKALFDLEIFKFL